MLVLFSGWYWIVQSKRQPVIDVDDDKISKASYDADVIVERENVSVAQDATIEVS